MQVQCDLKLDYDPTGYFEHTPFCISFVDLNYDPQTLHLTEAEMAYLFEKAMVPLMRARASRSTPGLVHP